MSWFQLDASTIACRVRGEGGDFHPPSLAASIARGSLGFSLVSVAAFAPWALAGPWLLRTLGEGGLYGVCAMVFIVVSGPLLHRLILGPGYLVSFIKLFTLAFTAQALAWMAGWAMWGGHAGSLGGLLAGTMVMGWMLTRAFDAQSALWRVIAVLFVGNVLGYLIGGGLAASCSALEGLGLGKDAQHTLAKLLWAVAYGAGFGAGLGWVFHLCQREAREYLEAEGLGAAAERR